MLGLIFAQKKGYLRQTFLTYMGTKIESLILGGQIIIMGGSYFRYFEIGVLRALFTNPVLCWAALIKSATTPPLGRGRIAQTA